jgi:hypothetical protein
VSTVIEVRLTIATPLGTTTSEVMSKGGANKFALNDYRPLPKGIPADSVAAVHWHWANWGVPEEPVVKQLELTLPEPMAIKAPSGNIGFSMNPKGIVTLVATLHAKAVPDAFVHYLMRQGALVHVAIKNSSGGWTALSNDNLQAPLSAAIIGEGVHASPPNEYFSKATEAAKWNTAWPKPTALPKKPTPQKITPVPQPKKTNDPKQWVENQAIDWDG